MALKTPFHLRNVLIRDISLLCSLVILLLINPYLFDTIPHRIIGSLMVLLCLVSAMQVMVKHKTILWIAGVLISTSIITEIVQICFPSPFTLEFHYIHKSVNFFFFAIVLFYNMLKQKTFIYADLANAVSIYLLIGLSFGFLYCYIETIFPGSFTYATPVNEKLPSTLIYFSYVTMATIGYGDISPVALIARFLAIFEAMFGLFYIAIIIGRMIGMRPAKPEE